MTAPAFSLFIVFTFLKTGMINKMFMTPLAVFLNYVRAHAFNPDRLRLKAECEHRRMSESVRSFKHIFSENIILRYVTVIAGGDIGMRADAPCCILRIHHVAVDAGLRFIRKIRSGVTDIQHPEYQTRHDSADNNDGRFPCIGRFCVTDKFFYILHQYKNMSFSAD